MLPKTKLQLIYCLALCAEGGNLCGSPGRTAQQDPSYAEADSSSSSDEEQTKAVQSGEPPCLFHIITHQDSHTMPS